MCLADRGQTGDTRSRRDPWPRLQLTILGARLRCRRTGWHVFGPLRWQTQAGADLGQRKRGVVTVAGMSPQSQLEGFIRKYAPEVAAEGRAALAKLRRLVPGAVELVYDNYNWLVVGFCPSERPSDAVLSLVFTPRWITLCFLQNGPALADPLGLLRGSGKRVRSIRLESARDLDKLAVRALIKEALASAWEPIDRAGRGRLVIRSVSAKQRPRRPA
jgi:hypothetical protein